eukprot:Phypoly_transcript_20594.p1 GENE.Phypoly_transcript_20594~~Phypoly_transcript_20594.p1  ORF type:complete len:212 (+),score=37.51 Phypoly_transcript_20594:84-638(+)
MGSYDTRVAECAAKLVLNGTVKYCVMTGGRGRLTPKEWPGTEAEKFGEIAQAMGVPKEKIVLESTSTNTGENLEFSRKLLASLGLPAQRLVVVHIPFMARRAYGCVKKQWEEAEVAFCLPNLDYESEMREEKFEKLETMVGEVQRTKYYPKLGFVIEQDIPKEVWDATTLLIEAGFKKYYIKPP